MSGRRQLIFLLAFAALAYAPFLGGGFLTDDFAHARRLQRVHGFAEVFTTPDTFGFFRPVPQASLLLESRLFGWKASAFRLTNLVLHLTVAALAFLIARLLLGDVWAAFLATLAFLLTPKAHPIAVLWISARAELLMAVFCLTSIALWLHWNRGGRAWTLIAAWAAYGLALLSKESAVLLPVLLLVLPPSRPWLTARRAGAVIGMAVTAAALLVLRSQTGALMPVSIDAHYNLATPLRRWLRNTQNYVPRALPSPLALLVLVGVPAIVQGGRDAIQRLRESRSGSLLVVAAVWFAVFILPVVAIPLRSELYLYLPVLGACLAAGALVAALVPWQPRRGLLIMLGLYVAAAGAYQASRSGALRADLDFSRSLQAALLAERAMHQPNRVVFLVPEDSATERHLQDAIGGFLDDALEVTFQRTDIDGTVGFDDAVPPPSALQLGVRTQDNHAVLRVR